jgi:hypothetical protein
VAIAIVQSLQPVSFVLLVSLAQSLSGHVLVLLSQLLFHVGKRIEFHQIV